MKRIEKDRSTLRGRVCLVGSLVGRGLTKK